MSEAVNKADLTRRVAMRAGISDKDAGAVVDHVIGAMQETLSNGEEVSIVGFGCFRLRERAARAGRNPQTGTTIQIPASLTVVFRPGKKLKDAVQQNLKGDSR